MLALALGRSRLLAEGQTPPHKPQQLSAGFVGPFYFSFLSNETGQAHAGAGSAPGHFARSIWHHEFDVAGVPLVFEFQRVRFGEQALYDGAPLFIESMRENLEIIRRGDAFSLFQHQRIVRLESPIKRPGGSARADSPAAETGIARLPRARFNE